MIKLLSLINFLLFFEITQKLLSIIDTYLFNELRLTTKKAWIRQRYQSQSSLGLRLQHLGYAYNNAGKDFSEYNK